MLNTIASSLTAFRGIPVSRGDTLSPELSPVRFPVGFDAVAQFDQRLVNAQLVRNLLAAGAAELAARVPLGTEAFPPEVQEAVRPHLTRADGLTQTAFLELRLRAPQLLTLGTVPVPPVSDGGVVISPRLFAEEERPVPRAGSAARTTNGLGGSPVAVAWTVELNLLRIRPDGVLTDGGAPPSGPQGPILRGATTGVFADVLTGVLTGGQPAGGTGSAGTESRVLLAAGQAVTRMPAHVVARPELLQAWLELDAANTQTMASSDEPPLTALLKAPRGQDLLRTALAALVNQAGLRLSPRVSPAGNMAPQYVAALGLTDMRVVHSIRLRPDGSEVLSLCFSFGDSAGSLAQVQPFLGGSHFGYFISLAALAPVVRTRWRFQRAARTFVDDVHVEMPLHEGAEETGQGTVRVRVQLDGTLSGVGLMALEGENGDVLRLGCDEEVQLLRAWYADGSEVGDLGELGDPATLPLVVNIAPFTAAAPGEERETPFRAFLRHVLEPVALPFVERFEVRGMSGFASEARGAMVARWSMPGRLDGIIADPGTVVVAGGPR